MGGLFCATKDNLMNEEKHAKPDEILLKLPLWIKMHLIGVAISFPLFCYQYIHEHGFPGFGLFNWFEVFGLAVVGIQAMFWEISL